MSRNTREGAYVGCVRGHHVRGQATLPGLVWSRDARRIATRRVLKRAGKHLTQLRQLLR